MSARRRHYEVIVSNIGIVYAGDNAADSYTCYLDYREQVAGKYGRAAGETVTLFDGDTVTDEYCGAP